MFEKIIIKDNRILLTAADIDYINAYFAGYITAAELQSLISD